MKPWKSTVLISVFCLIWHIRRFLTLFFKRQWRGREFQDNLFHHIIHFKCIMDSDNIYNFAGPQIPLHSPISMYYILIANHTHACIFLIDRDLQMDIYIYTYINTQIYMLCHMHVHTLERVEQTNKTNKQKQNRKRRYMKKKIEEWAMGAQGRRAWKRMDILGKGREWWQENCRAVVYFNTKCNYISNYGVWPRFPWPCRYRILRKAICFSKIASGMNWLRLWEFLHLAKNKFTCLL